MVHSPLTDRWHKFSIRTRSLSRSSISCGDGDNAANNSSTIRVDFATISEWSSGIGPRGMCVNSGWSGTSTMPATVPVAAGALLYRGVNKNHTQPKMEAFRKNIDRVEKTSLEAEPRERSRARRVCGLGRSGTERREIRNVGL